MVDEISEDDPFTAWKDPATIVRARAAMFRNVAAIRKRVELQITAIYGSTDFTNNRSVDRMVELLIVQVNAGQLQVANITSAYLANLMSFQTGTRVAPARVDRKEILGVRKVDPRVEYRRPAVTLYTALSKAVNFDAAKARGLTRLVSLAMTDIQLSNMKQASHSMSNRSVKRYRRTLSGSENCYICEMAATQRYWTGDLAPIHGHCDCGVEPLPPGFPGGQVIDPKGLAELDRKIEDFSISEGGYVKLADGSQRPITPKDISFNRNSEMGLTLGWANHNHTTYKKGRYVDLNEADTPIAKPIAKSKPKPSAKPVIATKSKPVSNQKKKSPKKDDINPKKLTAGDLTQEQGDAIAALSVKKLNGKMSQKDFDAALKRIIS